MSALSITDLVIEYASGGYAVRPIDGLSLEVADGELVLLLGASGCGKTTLLSALAAILTPTAGSIRVGGREVAGLGGEALTRYRRQTCGVVFQAFNLVPSLSAWENVAAPLWAAGVKGRAAREKAVALLESVDLGHRLDHLPGDLSGGQQQRVAIARALVHDPPLILADEPTAHLDFVQVDGVLELVRGLAQPGRVVVIATHDERLLPLADRVVELTPRREEHGGPAEERRELVDGEVLFRMGDAGRLVYTVDAGAIDLVRPLAAGGEEVLRRVGPGDYFGELAPMFGMPRAATARAVGGATVVGTDLRTFRTRQGQPPEPRPTRRHRRAPLRASSRQ
jgi:putative ABC transport system ATP-binding protein